MVDTEKGYQKRKNKIKAVYIDRIMKYYSP